MFQEQLIFTNQQDEQGITEGDLVTITPLGGRKYEFKLLRLNYDFISHDREVTNSWCKVLGRVNKESFHVRISQVSTIAKGNIRKHRFMIKVIEGSPIKLNGVWILEGFLENYDVVEIGYNSIRFSSANVKEQGMEKLRYITKNENVIKSEMNILLQGETGVGKSSLAKHIHENSSQVGKFVHVNLSSFSVNLIESELFGHIRGAFTGALKDKVGAIEEAHLGTLFIDEIDSLPIDIQTKLLLFLDNQKARAVGGEKDYQVRTRLIFSSGRDLKGLVQQGKMRKDFYYRITSGHKITLPCLRDDSQLVEKFCKSFEREESVRFTSKLIDFYKTLPWPGNYRQLKGHLKRKLILCKSTKFDFDEVDEELIEQSSELIEISEKEHVFTLEEVKKAYVKKIYYQCQSNYRLASQRLRISEKSIKSIVKV